MSNSVIQASKPGKLILLGEYAVLEQAPCLVAAVDKNCDVHIEPLEGEVFRIEASNPVIGDLEFVVAKNNELRFKNDLSKLDKERLRFVTAVLKNVIRKYGSQFNPAVINIDTENFYHTGSGEKLGLGASAAITVSLLAALREYVGAPLSGVELYRAANPIHRKAQGKLGSGSDIAASAVGGVIQYQMPESAKNGTGVIEPLEWPENLEVIPVWAGKSASTQSMVQQVEVFKNAEPESYNTIMEPMTELAEAGCKAFQSGDVNGLLKIIDYYVRQEQRLGEASNTDIVSDAHRKIAEIVNKSGGTYKPSGAGNGDMGVAFCNGIESRKQVENALQKSEFDIIDLSMQTQELVAENLQ